MKSFFKKLILGSALVAACLTVDAGVVSTNVTSAQTFLLLSGRANVYTIEVTSTNTVLLDFFDCNTLAAPFYGTNYTNAAWTSRTAYATNYITSYVGQNNFTNWYTNAGLWTATTTNAAGTNALSAAISIANGANTYSVHTMEALFNSGIVIRTTGGGASVTVNYRSSQ